MYGTTILCKQICERSEYICLQTKYEQLLDMNVIPSDPLYLKITFFYSCFIAVHTALKRKSTHFVCAFSLQKQFVLGKHNSAIHIFRFTKLISHISFYLFDVNCAFFSCSDFVIAIKL